MTTDIESPLTPSAVLDAARRFFLGADRLGDAWIESESETHITFCTFRGNLSIAAFPGPDGPDVTRVRVTTLREEGIVPRLLTHIRGPAIS
ncbi:MAG: hypothetical protein MJB57_04390 [Gemmatimonadetes bacterium]|nr:hypothetical protein [Gemmatimonadota bacterium]